jgi:hypothetical protein
MDRLLKYFKTKLYKYQSPFPWHHTFGSQLGPPTAKQPLRKQSIGHNKLVLLSFCFFMSHNFLPYNSTQKSGSIHPLDKGKEARKCDILLIIIKINHRAKSRYCKYKCENPTSSVRKKHPC